MPPRPRAQALRAGMVSLGCSKNLVDSERILGTLKAAGYEITPHAEQADLVLVNTCAFVRSAQEESIESVLEMARYKEEGRCKALVVVGCLPQRFGHELAAQIPEVDAWVGVGQIPRVLEVSAALLADQRDWSGHRRSPLDGDPEEAFPRLLSTPPHYAYLKVSEGCRNHCAYCVIPSIRGELRSRPLNSLVREAEGLARGGVKELILVAQDLGEYGKDLAPPATLMSLLEGLSAIEGLEWIRLLYLHPAHVPDEIVRALATEPKICPYLDLPLQHIDDRILKAMNRGITSVQIWSLIERLRSAIPHLSLRTTVMVGFPGEDQSQFFALLDFIHRAQFDHLGAFAYSREEGTPAARRRGQVPERVKEERLGQVMDLQAGISREKNRRLVGSRQRILIDQSASLGDPRTRGRMSRQAPEVDGVVYVRGIGGSPGEFEEMKIVGADTYDLVAERLV